MKSVLPFVVCGALAWAGSASAALITVHVYNFDFSLNPSGNPVVDPVINVGDTVEWLWDGGLHSSTSAAGQAESWDSGLQSTVGFTFEHTFTQPGTFEYYCLVHGSDSGDGTAVGMAGIITVVPEPSSLVLVGIASLAMAGPWVRRRR